jgi:peptidoglycan/xylan/chitin deacetylase (PgdA/CDA1 family)
MSKTIPILMYHSLDTDRFKDKLAISKELFEKQMKFLANSFQAITLKESISLGSQEGLFGAKVVISFDDGYLDNYTEVFPILQRYKLPAIFFVSPDKIGQKGYMNINMLREMHQAPNVEIGSHGLYHESLADVSPERAEKSIFESKKSLEGMLMDKVTSFSYPSGSFNSKVVELVKEAGYERACAASRVHEKELERDPFTLRRIKISETSSSNFSFVFRLSGFYNLLRKP